MDLLSLVARLTLDSSEYDKGLKGAVSNAGKIAGTVGKAASVAIGAATTAVAGFATASVGVGANFDAAMSQVAAVSGATGKDFDKLRDKAQEMGAKTKFSASESAEAFNYMAMAGWKTSDMLDGIEGVMNLAAASGENLGTTSDIVTDALTAFGLKAKDSGHFADILAAASSNANTNVSMMGETFKYAAPVAGAFGFSAEDTAEAIGLMANSGIKASQAGTSLRVIMSKMAGPIKISGKAIGDMEIKTTKADGTMRDLNDILDDCRSAFNKLTPAERAVAAESIAGKNAMSGFLALMNSGEDDIHKLRKAIEDCDGATEKMADTMQDNLTGDITIFKSALEGAQIVVSDKLTPAIRKFVKLGTDGLSKMTKAFKAGNYEKAMKIFGNVISNGLTMVVKGLPKAVKAGVQLLSSFVDGMLKSAPIIGKAALDIIAILAKYLIKNAPQMAKTAGKMLTMFGDYVTTNLPKLVKVALKLIETFAEYIARGLPNLIPTIVAIIYTIEETLTNPSTINRLFDAANRIINGLAVGIVKSIPIVVEKAPIIIDNLITAFKENFPKLLETGKLVLSMLADGIKEAFPELSGAVDSVKETIKNAFNAIKGFWDTTLKPALDTILTFTTETLIPNVKTAWEGLQTAVETVFTAIAGFWTSTLQPALVALYDYVYRDLIPTLIVWFEYYLGPAIEGVFKGIKEWWDTYGKDAFDSFLKVVQDIGGYVSGAFKTAIDFMINNFDTLLPIVTGLTTAFVAYKAAIAISSIIDAVTKSTGLLTLAQQALNAVMNANPIVLVVSALAGLAAALVTAYNTNDEFKQKVDAAWQAIKTAFDTYVVPVGEWIRDTFIKAWDDLKTAIGNIIGFLQGDFSTNWQTIWNNLVDWVSTPFNKLGELIKVPINAVIGMLNSMIDAVENGVNWIVDGVNNALTFRVPDWIPVVGGKEWKPDLHRVEWDRIQELANGGVLKPGQRAIVGEYAPEYIQMRGNQAVVTPMGSGSWRFPGGQQQDSGPQTMNIILELDGQTFARAVYKYNKQETQRVGMSFSNARL